MAILQLCVSQADNDAAYMFRLTNTKVFSLEEALFHAYYSWKQTADELAAPEFINWVRNDLKLLDIADKLAGYLALPFSDRLINCLCVIDYFDDSQINSLAKELNIWEKRVEWEKLKERGDYLVMHGMPAKAVTVYRKALSDSRRVSLLNNLAVALMHVEHYSESADLLKEALEQQPSNNELKLHYAESCIYAGKTREALTVLEDIPPSDAVFRVFGELYRRAGDSQNALKSFIAAAESSETAENIYRLTDYYMQTAEFDNACSNINRIKSPNALTAIKKAELHKAQNDFASACGVLEEAVKTWPNDSELWLELSECCRRNSSYERANQAITKALSLQQENPRVMLEAIKLKRAQNRPREYQEALRNLINILKNEYRDTEEVRLP